ncbi:predicted protein [Verticillium alfalfae VaMs.102]|uniref:Predicted protein n=1 Tax=Verticillium alfalfae (strain VaMs.102 / ATCC MYA-4576 / FGSC 10136) TaxID=526221 RepID=C9SBP7_VERA1|nr:predicted protein [Verticillium alfalfae VaMs.102]EEY15781.1 predicted protein [Verticillium alfalfae VaMs.102]
MAAFVRLQPRSGKTDAHSCKAQRSTRGDAKKANDDQRDSTVGDVSIQCVAGGLIEVQARHERWDPTKRLEATRHSGTVKRHGDVTRVYGTEKTRYDLWRFLLISESTTW